MKNKVGRPQKNKPMKSIKIYEETLEVLKIKKTKTKKPIIVLIDEAVNNVLQ